MENKSEQNVVSETASPVEEESPVEVTSKEETPTEGTSKEETPTEGTSKEETPNQETKKDKKSKKQKKPRRPFKVVMKTWSKGLGKETNRITWEKKSQVIKDFVVILVVSVILAVLFFGIDMIIITIRK